MNIMSWCTLYERNVLRQVYTTEQFVKDPNPNAVDTPRYPDITKLKEKVVEILGVAHRMLECLRALYGPVDAELNSRYPCPHREASGEMDFLIFSNEDSEKLEAQIWGG